VAPQKMKPFKLTMREILRDPREAAAYLNSVMEERNLALFMRALRNVADANIDGEGLSNKSKFIREKLKRIFLKKRNPSIQDLQMFLEAFGLKIQVRVIKTKSVRTAVSGRGPK
jgi:DNA-binding phage protein